MVKTCLFTIRSFGGVLARWAVARAIYPYMVSIGLVYFTTLSLYPGISSEVPSCRLGTWMPIILMSAFNLFDFIGKMYPIMFSVILGFTNGLFGSVPMIMAPSRVGREHREIAGNMMTLSYNGGLLSGSLVSYLLLSMLGEPSPYDPCEVNRALTSMKNKKSPGEDGVSTEALKVGEK
ncbi:nucleoside transporter domain-containing protein [Phthorimaea operculella]|nr:nucleoside transporter domain-containing protein [Phthorimaea operculella]